jgi:hypothetical protein
LIDRPAENVSTKNKWSDLQPGIAQLALFHLRPFFFAARFLPRVWMKYRGRKVHLPVGRVSACLLLTSAAASKIKGRQAEARPTKINS